MEHQEQVLVAGNGVITLAETGATQEGVRTEIGTATSRGGRSGRRLPMVVVAGVARKGAMRGRAREDTRGAGAAAGSVVVLVAGGAGVWSAVGA